MKDTLITDNMIVLKDTIAQINHTINLCPNSENDSQLISNAITILLALVAALIALYQMKSNTISSARISWIENLRQALCEYCAEVNNCATILSNMHEGCLKLAQVKKEAEIEKKIDEYYPSYIESSNKINILGNKVLLYLNSKETNHSKVESYISEIYKHLHKEKMAELDMNKIESELDEIITTSKLIFKEEWTKSKKIFRI